MKPQSFDTIYEELFPVVYRFVFLRIPSADLEDVTAEIMTKIWRSIPDFEQRSSLKTWGLKIAANYIVDYYRRRKEIVLIPITDDLHHKPSNSDIGEDVMTLMSVHRTLSQLNETQASVIQLRLIEGFSATETASILGTTQQAVDSMLYRAKKNFRMIYQSETLRGESR